MEGERVVIGGNFLVDSESRLAGNAARGVDISIVEDPVCGMSVDVTAAMDASDYAGKTYHFCSPRCKARFDKGPLPYL
jgi:Cu+-exporting ATPase